MGDPVTTSAIIGGATSAGSSLIKGKVNYDRQNQDKKVLSNETEDLNSRREATYRQDRGMLLSALGSYYKSQGWDMPSDALPGAGTSKQLPFENPLYNGPRDKMYANPETANPQPGRPVYQDSNPATAPTDGTDGSANQNIKANPDSATSGNIQQVGPSANAQQTAAAAGTDAQRALLYKQTFGG